MPYKLLFVCLGNICRSPAAENIMVDLIEKANLSSRIICDSAGTSSYHIGSPPDERMTQACSNKLGIKMRGRARQFKKSDFQEFDLILAMDKDNYHSILYLDPAGEFSDKVRLMCDFCQRHTQSEVPDPYYGGQEGFNQVIDLLSDACEGLLEYVTKQL